MGELPMPKLENIEQNIMQSCVVFCQEPISEKLSAEFF
jgi:hypothetical protein